MKGKLFVAMLTVLISASSFGLWGRNETALFDKEGEAKAFISEDSTIYLWDGAPVAYLSDAYNAWHIYGFNGDHLGWYANGIIYNNDGDIVGAQKGAANLITLSEIGKGMKSMKPFPSLKKIAPGKPIFSSSWSKTPLEGFLKAGKD
ncbi:4-fold beta flower protein [Mucilaginibacter sp. PAMB04168]|uniref:4-fold beta flower protein n=1 Tax=Mucilaginibacter sp. PAMB04168 TaxID=3138567 RepID=UPI0031F706B6